MNVPQNLEANTLLKILDNNNTLKKSLRTVKFIASIQVENHNLSGN